MSESAAMSSSRARLISRTPVSLIAASIAILAFAPGPRPAGGPARPDTLAAFRNPSGIAVGSDGTVYVASQGDSSVVVYAPGVHGLVTPLRRIGPRSGLVSPQAIALDSRGRLLVSNGPHQPEGKGSITVYAPGARGDAAPARVIAGVRSGLNQPSALALGPRGRLFVVNGPRTNDLNINGVERGAASSVLTFDAHAAGDDRPAETLLDILDTIVRPPPPPPPPPPPKQVRIDTVCAGPPQPPGGSQICQLVERVETSAPPFLQSIPFPQPGPSRQRPDTIRPLDLTVEAGRLLVLTVRGVTTYDRALVRTSRPYDRQSPDSTPPDGPRFYSTCVALGPGRELFVGRRTPSRLDERMMSELRSRRSAQQPGGFFAPSLLGPVPSEKPAATPRTRTDTVQKKPRSRESSVESPLGHAFISVYRLSDRGDTTAVRTIEGPHAGLASIVDLAVGADGSLYVLGSGGTGPSPRIAVFGPGAKGDVAPVRVIEGKETGLKGATSLALDSGGRIYVANNRNDEDPILGSATITVYPPDADGDAAPVRMIAGWSTRLSKPSSIAVADDGTIYVANLDVFTDDRGSVQTFPPLPSDGARPVRTLMGHGADLASPQGIAVGRADTLYVLSPNLSHITIYRPGADGPIPPERTIEGDRTSLRYPAALPARMALDAAGFVYVADAREASGLNAYGPDLGAVRVFRPGTEGNEWPVRTIIGGFTKLNGPGGMAIDRAGNLYVPNRYATGPGSVTVYGPRADGDARPLRLIAGPTTGLQAPAAVALDAHDTLYVVNEASVTVYTPGAAGDVAPVRTIAAR